MDEKEEIITPEEDKPKTVPLSRFNEVYGEKKALEEKLKEKEVPDDKKEQEAKNYLKNLQRETLKEIRAEEEKAKEQELANFNKEVAEILELNSDVKKADFLKFIEEEAEKYGVQSVSGSMSLYRKFEEVSKTSSDKTKREISSKPKLPSNEGGGNETYNDSGKSLYQIANEAKKELNK